MGGRGRLNSSQHSTLVQDLDDANRQSLHSLQKSNQMAAVAQKSIASRMSLPARSVCPCKFGGWDTCLSAVRACKLRFI